MKSRNHLLLVQIAFGVMLMAVFLGWLVFVLELVKRDAEVAEARVREVEMRFLEELAGKFSPDDPTKGQIPGQDLIKQAAKSDRFAGIWFDGWIPIDEEPESHPRTQPYLPELATSRELIARQKDLFWGQVTDGRDRLGSLILKIAREEGADFEAMEMLAKGVWDYSFAMNGMSPGFRLLLIAELAKHDPSEELDRLKIAETIRAVEGQLDELPMVLEKIQHGEVAVFYRRDQLMKQFNSERVELTAVPLAEQAAVRVAGLNVWPYLSLKDGESIAGETVSKSERAVYLVGIATLISTIGLVGAAVWLGRRQLRLARARTDLAASVAHELRTPLAGQRIVLESMLEKDRFDRNYLEMALRENQRLGDLSEEFLTFSRLERGVLDLPLVALDLAPLIKNEVSRFCTQFPEDEVELSGDCSEKVMADSAAVTTILGNLLENARKYSQAPRKIEVVMFEGGFEVKDNGIGLSAGDQKKIFRQFYRVERTLSRSNDGLGIGLSIVRRLVEAMNGRIEVISEKGRGSVFRVTLGKGSER